jgi:hypothetical protein
LHKTQLSRSRQPNRRARQAPAKARDTSVLQKIPRRNCIAPNPLYGGIACDDSVSGRFRGPQNLQFLARWTVSQAEPLPRACRRHCTQSPARCRKGQALVQRVHLLRQPGQVSHDDECPRANESRQAHREQNPQKLSLFGAQVEGPPHCFARLALFLTGNTARPCSEKAAARFGPIEP